MVLVILDDQLGKVAALSPSFVGHTDIRVRKDTLFKGVRPVFKLRVRLFMLHGFPLIIVEFTRSKSK